MTRKFDRMPDRPQSFGYKDLWFALRTQDPAAVIAALGLEGAISANWASGLPAACPERMPKADDLWLFVTPPVRGWVLAAGALLPYPTIETHHDIGQKFDAAFAELMRHFEDVQFFGSHRVSGFCAWARALEGEPVRIFSYGDGQVLANVGDQTGDEAKLGLVDLTGLSPSDADDRIFALAEEQDAEEQRLVGEELSLEDAQAKLRPNGRSVFPDENDVIELAGLWSIDPTRLAEEEGASGVGLAVRLPERLQQ